MDPLKLPIAGLKYLFIEQDLGQNPYFSISFRNEFEKKINNSLFN